MFDSPTVLIGDFLCLIHLVSGGQDRVVVKAFAS